jgi:hypothetical protein
VHLRWSEEHDTFILILESVVNESAQYQIGPLTLVATTLIRCDLQERLLGPIEGAEEGNVGVSPSFQ